MAERIVRSPADLLEACRDAQPGDVILVHARSYYNGGFLSAKGIRGQVVVRGNRIMDAYNGVRMKGLDMSRSDPEPPADVNADVHIFDNDFIRIRDNPIEPEGSAWNWHVRHNRLVDCHSWFSFDGVRGGLWYFYGNTGRFESRQGEPGQPAHAMGRVLKLSYAANPPDDGNPGVPDAPWYVFNNSWHLRCPIVGGANPAVPRYGEGPDFTAQLDFFNNAFTWCSPTRDGAWVCQPIEMLRHLDLAASPGTIFDHDISDRPDFFAELRRQNRPERHGLVAVRPIFINAPAATSPSRPGARRAASGRCEASPWTRRERKRSFARKPMASSTEARSRTTA